MAKMKVSQEDINRNKLVEPGLWYTCEVINVNEALTKAGDSTNTNIDLQITEGTFKGTMLYRTFNEKAPGFGIPFLKAFGIDVQPDVEYDLDATKGRKLRCFVKHREWNGQTFNDVVDFRPID